MVDFLSSDSVATLPHWVGSREDRLRNVRRHEVVVLDGGHFLHWTVRGVGRQVIAFLDAGPRTPRGDVHE